MYTIFLKYLILLMLINGLYLIIKYLYTINYIKSNFPLYNKKTIAPNKELPFFHLLIPVLNEEKNIDSLFKELNNINYPNDKHRITLITTEKELLLTKPHPNTIELIKKKLLNLSSKTFSNIHYPAIDGFKAEQLNYAFNIIINQYNNKTPPNNTFFCSIDADSTIHKDFFMILAQAIEDKIDIYQQPIIWFRNINFIKNNLQGLLLKGFAINQTFHSLAYEIAMINGWWFPYRLKYL